jgi:DNA invertase Pin-like site-specific DNA recombinase
MIGGSGSEKRPAFDQILRDAARRRTDVLLSPSMDRLGRSVLHVAPAMAELYAAGLMLISDGHGTDVTGPFGHVIIQMATVFAELERSMIGSRMTARLDRIRAEGKMPSRPRSARRSKTRSVGSLTSATALSRWPNCLGRDRERRNERLLQV